MTTATELLKAGHVGVREFKEHMTADNLKKVTVITDHGKPISVNLPYDEVLELMDILDDLRDETALKAVGAGRKSIKEGQRGVAVSGLFKKIKTHVVGCQISERFD